MDPCILSGDLILVEKFSTKIGTKPQKGEIVLFKPPRKLEEVVVATGGRLGSRDLFVKRVAGTPGDKIHVDQQAGYVYVNEKLFSGVGDGQACDVDAGGLIQGLLDRTDISVPPHNTYVLGDCGEVSVDSRVWGPLDDSNLVGRPILRLWPPGRFGAIP